MSSWSPLLALSGFRWDATTGTLAFAPKINQDDFRCFFSAGTGWGTFEQRRDREGYSAAIRLLEGELTLRVVIWSAAPPALRAPASPHAAQEVPHSKPEITVTLDDQPLPAPRVSGDRIAFAEPVALRGGQVVALFTEL